MNVYDFIEVERIKLKRIIGKKVVKVTETYDWTILTFEDGTVVKIDYFEVEKEEERDVNG